MHNSFKLMYQFETVMLFVKNKDLIKLAEEHSIDKSNTKIVGTLIFTGLIKLILSWHQASLRMLEMLINQGQEQKKSLIIEFLSD